MVLDRLTTLILLTAAVVTAAAIAFAVHRQRQLRESEKRFPRLAESAPVLIWMSGLDKGCTYFNPGWLEMTGRQAGGRAGQRMDTRRSSGRPVALHGDLRDGVRCADAHSRWSIDCAGTTVSIGGSSTRVCRAMAPIGVSWATWDRASTSQIVIVSRNASARSAGGC